MNKKSTLTESEKSAPPTSEKRTISLRWYLLLLVLGVILPFVLFAIGVTYKSSIDERAAAERRLLASSQELNQKLEQELSASIRALQTLAASEALDTANYMDFYNEAARVKSTQPTWLTIILLNTDGRQAVNIDRPIGEELPSLVERESFDKLLETKQPTIGFMARGEKKTLAFPVRVPVFRAGELRYVLTAVITADALSEIVRQKSDRNTEWTRTVVDGRGTIAARTRDPERFVGTRAPDSFLKRTNDSPEGVYRETSLENTQVYFGFVRSPDSNWVTVVVVPAELIDAPGMRAIRLVVGFGVGLLLISIVGAIFLSRHISGEITKAAGAAQLLVQGQTLNIRTVSRIREVKQLNEALEFSSELLHEREEEREKHLAQSESARRAAETASKLKDEFLITVSHELRTPLNSILGWVTLLRASEYDEAKFARAHEVIERNARSQASLIEDLLDMSRIITGKLKLEAQAVNLNEIIATVLDSTRHAAEAKEIKLALKTDSAVPSVTGDADRLQQVVWNLVSNAVKFTPRGGKVTIELARQGAEIKIIVSDTGKGIDPEFLPFVFERFRQADGSTRRNHGGLGLGLAIVKHLVELHGGSVEAHSRGEDAGASFIVSIPLKTNLDNSPPKVSGDLATEKTNGFKLEGVKILVIDDEADTRELIESILAPQGAEIRVAASVSEAFSALEKWTPSIILSDIGMPNEDGFDFIQRLKELENVTGRKLPAAALTAYTRPEDRARVLSAGYIEHISKPIDSVELIDLVTSLIESEQRKA